MTNTCSTLVYVKLLLLWALVLATDYLLEFRFEYLWWALHSCFSFSLSILSINCLTVTICPCNRPFWLLVRSIYDSFKYQGLVKIQPHAAQNFTNLPLSGIFSIFHLHRPDQRHDLLPIYPCPLVVLRSKHLCLGAVCVAHRLNQTKMIVFCFNAWFLFSRKGHLPSNGVPLASLCLHRSRNSSEGNDQLFEELEVVLCFT